MRSDVGSYSNDIPIREKSILSGLYLSKYDRAGLSELGFSGFAEAFNVIGFALGVMPRSIHNYRDEFDPLFPNPRKGWHKRKTRDYCMAVLEKYSELDFLAFTNLVQSFFGDKDSASISNEGIDFEQDEESSFAQRLITGLAAENYFEAKWRELPEFAGRLVENTTRYGCGYDFRVRSQPDDSNYQAVEVKGLKEQNGNLSLTAKEHRAASTLRDRFYLFVVSNFRDTPSHRIFQDPLAGQLDFQRLERVTIQVSWMTRV
jgi:hypothetical protein